MWNSDIHEFVAAMRKDLLPHFSSFTCYYFLSITILSQNAGNHGKKGMISFGNTEQSCAYDGPSAEFHNTLKICHVQRAIQSDQGKIWENSNRRNLSPV